MSQSDLESNPVPNLRTFVYFFVFLFFIAIILSEIFSYVGSWVEELWFAALIVHALLIAIVLFRWSGAVKASNAKALQLFQSSHSIFHRSHFFYYLPAIVVLTGAIMLALFSRTGSELSVSLNIGFEQIAFILVVPLVEEVFYRWIIGGILRPRLGFLGAAYLSSLFFSLMHSQPIVERVLEGNIGFVLGPFFLGLLCEFLYGISSRLGPVILLHMSCNATVAIFAFLDPRWLEWLSPLYSG